MNKRQLTPEKSEARPLWVDALLLLVAGGIFVTLITLGNWQVRRLYWKLDLIEQVEARAYGTPVSVPETDDVPEYLRVQASGSYRHDLSLRIKAVTELGPGYWVMTPLVGGDHTLWVNRGFVPTGVSEATIRQPEGLQQVVGLMRLTRPEGTLLEKNDPEAGRWFSPDIPVMNATQDIAARSSFYIDAERAAPIGDWPQGGLTKLDFKNDHLSYALTWYAMAALFFAAMGYVIYSRVKAIDLDD